MDIYRKYNFISFDFRKETADDYDALNEELYYQGLKDYIENLHNDKTTA